jgi:acyl-CoA thioesterase-2
MTSFSMAAAGPNYQREMPTVEPPERLMRIEEQLAPYADEHDGWWVRPRAFDMRYLTPPPRIAADLATKPVAANRLWLRAAEPVPHDPVVMTCLLAYVSDLTLLDSVMIPSGRTSRGPGSVASLDHALWFHRPVDLNDWLLYDQHSPSAAGGRGLACGSIFSRSGELVCSVSQEGHLG